MRCWRTNHRKQSWVMGAGCCKTWITASKWERGRQDHTLLISFLPAAGILRGKIQGVLVLGAPRNTTELFRGNVKQNCRRKKTQNMSTGALIGTRSDCRARELGNKEGGDRGSRGAFPKGPSPEQSWAPPWAALFKQCCATGENRWV